MLNTYYQLRCASYFRYNFAKLSTHSPYDVLRVGVPRKYFHDRRAMNSINTLHQQFLYFHIMVQQMYMCYVSCQNACTEHVCIRFIAMHSIGTIICRRTNHSALNIEMSQLIIRIKRIKKIELIKLQGRRAIFK